MDINHITHGSSAASAFRETRRFLRGDAPDAYLRRLTKEKNPHFN